MQIGDIVIVPYGNTAFRAIAEVTGQYRFEPSADGYYAHRRDVRWLLTLEEPLPLDTIVDGNFTMRTLYSLPTKRVNLAALGRLIAGEIENDEGLEAAEDRVPDQFVLIIDEINRANISKVFGELITLIEPDKRLGHAFFIGCETAEQVHAAMRDKVIPLLQEYFFEDWSRIHAVLGDGFIQEDMLDPPPGIEGDRVSSWSVLKPFKADAFDRLIGKVIKVAEERGA